MIATGAIAKGAIAKSEVTSGSSQTYAYSGSGDVVLSGSATVSKIKSFLASGDIVYSGSALTSYSPPGATTYSYGGTGQYDFSGSATVAKLKNYLSSGTLTFSGSATYTNGTTLTDSQKIDLILDILSNRQELDASAGTYTLYADDGVTVLYTTTAWEDSAGTIPYRGRQLQRLDALQ